MHFEILVEDASGRALIELLMPKILVRDQDTWRVIAYKGIGRLPTGLKAKSDPAKRMLLNNLPRILQGYGRSLSFDSAVIVVVDLDDRDCRKFKSELIEVLERCDPRPKTLFRIAIEEIEAWILGDGKALRKAFPKVDEGVLRTYRQDSICGTWEKLDEALRPIGRQLTKKDWAEQIGRHMEVEKNQSPSFQAFRDGIRRLVES